MISTASENKRIRVMRVHIFIAVFIVHTAVLTFFVNIEPQSGTFHNTVWLMGLVLPIFTSWLVAAPPYTQTMLMLPRVFGSFLSVCAVFTLALAISLVFPAVLAFFGEIDVMHVLGAYTGLALLGIAYLSLGTLLRVLLGSGTALAFVSFVLSLCLFFTLFEHMFGSFAIGLIDFTDVVFFVSFSAFFMALAVAGAKGIKREVLIPRAILFGIVVVLINMLAAKPQLTADLTANRIFSLSAATIGALDELDEPVHIYAAFPPGRSDTHIEVSSEILRQYARHRNVNLHFTTPRRLSYLGFGDTHTGTIVVVQHGNSKTIPPERVFLTSFDEDELQISISAINIESELTHAILYCAACENLVVGQVFGQREYPVPQAFIDTLVSANFDVMDVFITEGNIPTEVSVLLITTPSSAWETAETSRLTRFLDLGGSAVFALDATNFEHLHHLYGVLAELGIELGGRLISETEEYLHMENNIIATALPLHAGGQMRRVLMPNTQAIYLGEGYNTDTNVVGVMTTSPYAFERANSWESTEEEYLGVFTLAAKVEAERKSTTTRAVVLGSSNIFDETANKFSGGENYRFLVDAINWMQHIEHYLDIPPTPLNEPRLVISNIQAFLLIGLLGFVFPAIILLTGLRRQN